MWQGVPFKFLEHGVFESSNVIISKIPHIVIDSSPDLIGPLLSVLGALFGGAIPAYVAIKAIRANKEQMLQQQKIINKQNFIDNLRAKLAIFNADAGRIALFINDEFTNKNIKLENAPLDVRNKLIELTHHIDLEYHYISLMISGKEGFKPVMKIMDEITDGISDSLHKSKEFNTYKNIDLLTEKAIECINNEMDSVIINA